jgi:hypothetical protein
MKLKEAHCAALALRHRAVSDRAAPKLGGGKRAWALARMQDALAATDATGREHPLCMAISDNMPPSWPAKSSLRLLTRIGTYVTSLQVSNGRRVVQKRYSWKKVW